MAARIGILNLLPFKRASELSTSRAAISPSWGQHTFAFIRITVLLSAVILMLPGAWGNSATVVEFAQLPAGLAAWQRHSLGIYRVCGPVSKFLYGLPAYLAGFRVDYPDSFDVDSRSRQEWEVGRLFQSQNRERYRGVYRCSRTLPILLTVLAGWLICEWSTRLFGAWPGIVSLCLWCWTPPILAHGSLVTSDMLSAVMVLLAARSFWAFLLKPTLLSASLVGGALGLAGGTKFTLLVLYPCWSLLLIGRAIQLRHTKVEGPYARASASGRLIALGVVVFAASIFCIDSIYLFDGVGLCLSDLRTAQSSYIREILQLEDRREAAWMLSIPMPIPLELVRGFDFQVADSERPQLTYLLGQTRLGGWWYWYIIAFLIKMPLPTLSLFALALLRVPSILRERSPVFWAALCLLVPAAEMVFSIAAMTGSGTSASFRYLVPSLALLCVWAGKAVRDARPRVFRLLLIVLLPWLQLNAVVSLPDHLGSQNELGWLFGRWSGKAALIGDNLDWGQDLARLADWTSQHLTEGSTVVCVHGQGDGGPYGLRPPEASSTSEPDSAAAFLAVSENVLLYITQDCVSVAGKPSPMRAEHCLALKTIAPHSRVGRTIRVYNLKDLPFRFAPNQHPTRTGE